VATELYNHSTNSSIGYLQNFIYVCSNYIIGRIETIS